MKKREQRKEDGEFMRKFYSLRNEAAGKVKNLLGEFKCPTRVHATEKEQGVILPETNEVVVLTEKDEMSFTYQEFTKQLGTKFGTRRACKWVDAMEKALVVKEGEG